jgi:hypothetical protein
MISAEIGVNGSTVCSLASILGDSNMKRVWNEHRYISLNSFFVRNVNHIFSFSGQYFQHVPSRERNARHDLCFLQATLLVHYSNLSIRKRCIQSMSSSTDEKGGDTIPLEEGTRYFLSP